MDEFLRFVNDLESFESCIYDKTLVMDSWELYHGNLITMRRELIGRDSEDTVINL